MLTQSSLKRKKVDFLESTSKITPDVLHFTLFTDHRGRNGYHVQEERHAHTAGSLVVLLHSLQGSCAIQEEPHGTSFSSIRITHTGTWRQKTNLESTRSFQFEATVFYKFALFALPISTQLYFLKTCQVLTELLACFVSKLTKFLK